MGAEGAAKQVQKMHVAQARATRKVLAEMRKKAKEHARSLGKKAKHAARASLKAARALEHTQRHAGVKEREFESAFLRNELDSERMEDHAEDLSEKAEEAVEHFYGRVEDVEERANDSKLHQLAEHLGQSVQSALHAGRSARAAQAPTAAKTAARAEIH